MKKALVSGICSVALLALALLVTTSPASAAKAPVGKTYFIVSLTFWFIRDENELDFEERDPKIKADRIVRRIHHDAD